MPKFFRRIVGFFFFFFGSGQMIWTFCTTCNLYCVLPLSDNAQNFSRYVKSRSDQQLLHGLGSNKTSLCKPEQSNNGLPIVPCGLVAWSLFNDTYKFIRGKSELNVDRKNIAWKSDRDHKFGKHVYPFNFQNGTLIGGGKLNSSVPVSNTSVQQFIFFVCIPLFLNMRLLNYNLQQLYNHPSPVLIQFFFPCIVCSPTQSMCPNLVGNWQYNMEYNKTLVFNAMILLRGITCWPFVTWLMVGFFFPEFHY